MVAQTAGAVEHQAEPARGQPMLLWAGSAASASHGPALARLSLVRLGVRLLAGTITVPLVFALRFVLLSPTAAAYVVGHRHRSSM